MNLLIDGEDITLGLGFGVDLCLCRRQEAGPARWSIAALLVDGEPVDTAPHGVMPAVPLGAFRDGLERAFQLQTGTISGREAQVARALLEEEMGELPTADDNEEVDNLSLQIAECASCSTVGRATGVGFFRECGICGKTTTTKSVQVEDASTFALVNFSEASLRKVSLALKNNRQHTIDAKRIGEHNASVVLLYCAINAGFDVAKGRLDKRPDLCRYYVDAEEGAGVV